MKRKILLRSAAALLVAVFLFLGYVVSLQFLGNFHAVVAGEVYRSNQPSAERIASYAQTYGIKTLLNLRGENDDQDWYRQEKAEAEKRGITLIDFPMSARQELPLDRAAELEKIMREAPKPLLIHCKAGADRTGLASAIYLARIAGHSVEEADGQLSLRYGHIGIPYLSKTYAMDVTWEDLKAKTPVAIVAK